MIDTGANSDFYMINSLGNAPTNGFASTANDTSNFQSTVNATTGNTFKGDCYKCGKQGHIASNCYKSPFNKFVDRQKIGINQEISENVQARMIVIETKIMTAIVIKIGKEIAKEIVNRTKTKTKTEIVTETAQGAETIALTVNLIISLNQKMITTEKSTIREWPMQLPMKQKTK